MKSLRRIRKAKGLSATELGYKAGSTYASIYAYENGTRKASAEVAGRIAKVLDTTVEELMKGE